MIPVSPQPEYPAFDNVVRQPGLTFLRRNPNPTTKQFRRHNYWKKAAGNLYTAYSGLCAYTSLHLAELESVDHFLPKAKYPRLAYEWDNFRVARRKINSRKGDTERILDPFRVRIGWFVLDFPSCLVRAGTGIGREIEKKVNLTIDILQLNNDDMLVQERCNWLVYLADGEITIEFLDRCYPFLSAEIRRQGIVDQLKVVFARNS